MNVESLIGQTRRMYNPNEPNDFFDYEIIRPARKGFVWVRHLDRDSETTMAVSAVLRDVLVAITQGETQ